MGFWNVREYVLFRDGHTCQCCKGKSKDKILNVHHIESRHTGGDAPNNLITLCETCHTGYHKGAFKLPDTIKRGMSFRDATFMGIMRRSLYNELKNKYSDVTSTYGYITKNTCIKHNLPKEHYIDARCISGSPLATPLGIVYYQKKVRCHNRQIHKNTILKGGLRKRNQAEYVVKGFRLFDKVLWKGKECFIFGRRATPGQVSISKDSDVEGLKKLVEAIHKNGSRVIAQINHAGSSARQEVTGMPIISASAVVNEGATGRSGEMPEAMTVEQIARVVDDFALAVKRAKEAGFDGVEIHSAHGYLLNQFYSPLTNKREDAYTGATLEGRLKIHQEVIQAVRKMVGPDYLVALRLGGCDYKEGGSTIADSVEAAALLEKWGIDLLDISGGLNGFIVPDAKTPGYFSEMTEQIKKKVSIPVILTGGITEIKDAEQLLEDKKADLIGVGRVIFKDSLWAERNMK